MNPSNEVFSALSDPTRRRIIRLLRAKRLTSGDISKEFDTSWATISRHLSVLKAAGLVQVEKNGQHVWYELNTTVIQDLIEHLLEWSDKGGDNA
jgi:DNA-binding transcriptional ArsR family regulator